MIKRSLDFMVNSQLGGQIVRYMAMASGVVLFEVGSFWVLNSILHINYLIATVLSVLVGIVLNWLGSKYVVFKKSRFSAYREFVLVLLVSLVGIGIQIITIYFFVSKLQMLPILGKVAAIGVTFVWNFFIRSVYIFKTPPQNK